MGEFSAHAVEVDGYELRVARAGAGAAVLVLGDVFGPGGIGGFHAALAKKHAVEAPTHPGFDATPTPEWLDNVSDLANFYLDYLKARASRGVHLVGLGVGGWIAADLATRDSSRLASLTLVNAAGLRVDGVAQADVFLGTEDEALRRLTHDPAAAERAIAETLTPESEDTRLLNQQYAARLTWQPRLHDPHLRKWLRRIEAPTLVAWGAENALFPKAYGAAWRDLIPGAKLETIAGCGHLAAFEKPAELAAIVSTFIAGQRVSA